MFISSKKILQSQRYSDLERKRSEENLKSLLNTAAEMPHKQTGVGSETLLTLASQISN